MACRLADVFNSAFARPAGQVSGLGARSLFLVTDLAYATTSVPSFFLVRSAAGARSVFFMRLPAIWAWLSQPAVTRRRRLVPAARRALTKQQRTVRHSPSRSRRRPPMSPARSSFCVELWRRWRRVRSRCACNQLEMVDLRAARRAARADRPDAPRRHTARRRRACTCRPSPDRSTTS